MMNAKEFGVTIAWQGATIEALRYIALESERLGLGYLWIPEAWGLEGFSTSSYLLSITTKIRIGTGVVNVYSRSAALIGMACATMDQIAPGRFILGLGSSGRAVVENFHGVRFERPRERTREYVEVVRKVARGESVEYSGDLLKLSRFRLFTKHASSPLEIYLGVMGARNLRLAGELCDGAIVTMYPISRLVDASRMLGAEEKKLFAYIPTMVLSGKKGDDDLSREIIARNIAFYITSMGKYYSSNLARLGFDSEVRRVIDAHARSGSKGATIAVGDELLDELALIGTRDQVIEKISRLPGGVHPVFAFSVRSAGELANSINSLRQIFSFPSSFSTTA